MPPFNIPPELLFDEDRDKKGPIMSLYSPPPSVMAQNAGPIMAQPGIPMPQPPALPAPKTSPDFSDIMSQFQASPEEKARQKAIDAGLVSQQTGVSDLQAQADALKNQTSKLNLKPLLSLADAMTGSNMAQGYDAPMTPEERQAQALKIQEQIQKAKGDVTDNQVKALKSQMDTKREQIAASLYGKMLGGQGKTGKDYGKQLSEMGKALDPYGPRNAEMGRQQKFANDADRILIFKDQYPDGMIPGPQFAEAASAAAALVGGGNHAAQETINRYVPPTAQSNAADIQQYLTSKLTPSDRSSFMQAMYDTADREKGLALGKVKDVRFSRIKEHSAGLDINDPTVQAVMQSHGVEPEEFATYAANGYKMPAKASVPNLGGQGGMPANYPGGRLQYLLDKKAGKVK